jgi:hypothetical protein
LSDGDGRERAAPRKMKGGGYYLAPEEVTKVKQLEE